MTRSSLLCMTPRVAHRTLALVGTLALLSAGARPAALSAQATPVTLNTAGLQAPVELIRDSAGIVHIRAANEHDLFFAQGYSAARDRLFQLELWRRQATGTMAEVFGARWVERDRASRLLKYRGAMAAELAHYHPRGATIITAFVAGVNAYIAQATRDPAQLPPEFRWLGLTPGRWTPEIVISRHNALASNAREELATARGVRLLGEAGMRRRRSFEPGPARLALDSLVTRLLDAANETTVMAAYDGFKNAPAFRATEVDPSVRRSAAAGPDTAGLQSANGAAPDRWESNNWVVDGTRTKSGKPIVANDPHRTISTPSLRYMVHLQAPGWDVIGGGEPAIPGVAIGHNRVGAWGLTIFGIDAEDLYVYETLPTDARAYRYRTGQERMREVIDTIQVKNAEPRIVRLRFTRHGPVLFEDSVAHLAVALRAAWLEVGGAPYLASLRLDQATSWTQFRQAVSYARMPALNWIWGDTTGAIGWQSAGIAPIRRSWDGLVPVPGDGRFEWGGFLPIADLPHLTRPASGAFGTANALNVPATYTHFDALARTWAEPFRLQRLTGVLDTLHQADVFTMARLQHDEFPIAARTLVPLLRGLTLTDAAAAAARDTLLAWNGVLATTSRGGALYAAWERRLSTLTAEAVIPGPARTIVRTIPLARTLDLLTHPDSLLGANPVATRDGIVRRALTDAVADLTRRFGGGIATWQYGDARFHHVRIAHPLDAVLVDSARRTVSPGPLARGGYANTLNATGNSDNQTAGASFRFVVDLANWDSAIATNTPGQSGDPRSPHYADLFPLWASGQYVPLPFSRAAVRARTESVVVLRP